MFWLENPGTGWEDGPPSYVGDVSMRVMMLDLVDCTERVLARCGCRSHGEL